MNFTVGLARQLTKTKLLFALTGKVVVYGDRADSQPME
jgi:hypothetical protein